MGLPKLSGLGTAQSVTLSGCSFPWCIPITHAGHHAITAIQAEALSKQAAKGWAADTRTLLLLSMVCRAFAAAIETSDLLKQTLCTHMAVEKGAFRHAGWGSRLILQWAGRFTGLDLFSQICEVPGARQLAAAAPSVTYVAVHCRSMLQAAQADCLLTRLSSVKHLLLHGDFYPSMLPLPVRELEVRP